MEERRPWSRFIKWGSEMAVHFPVTHSLCIKYILWGQCFWPVNSRCGGRWLTLTEYSQALVLLNGFYDCSYFCLFVCLGEEVILPNDWLFLIHLREGNEPEETSQITYRELLVQVCRFSNVLRKQGECGDVGRGLESPAGGYLRTWEKLTRNRRNLLTEEQKGSPWGGRWAGGR